MTPYQKRYGGLVPDSIIQPNKFIDNLLGRYSERRFNGKSLEPGVLELLVAAAQSAPTSGTLQSWSVIALTTPEEKAKLFGNNKQSDNNLQIIGGIDSHNVTAIETSAVVLIWLADLSRIKLVLDSAKVADDIKEQPEFAEYHLKAIIDATIAAQTLYLAAESMGITGTYCGAIRQLPIKFLEKEFNLPKYTFPIFGTIHGYNNTKYTRRVKPRLPSELVLHRGTYTKLENVDDLERHNTTYVTHSANSGYCARVVERLRPSDTKNETGIALRHMGFDFK
jgi:nitroreductase